MTARDEAWSQAAAPKAKYSIELDPGPDKGGTPFDVLAKQYLSGLDAGTDDPAFTGRDVDATEMDEVYLDADASEQDAGLPAIAKAQPAAPAEKDESGATNGIATEESA